VADGFNVKEWSTPLAAGKYKIRVKKGELVREVAIDMPADRGLKQTVVMNAGIVRVIAKMTDDGEKVRVDRWDALVPQSDGTDVKFNSDFTSDHWSALVPAGKVKLRAKRGAAVAEKTIEITAGGQADVPLVFNSGMLNVIATLVPGSTRLKADVFQVTT